MTALIARSLVLATALMLLCGTGASADPITLTAYEQALVDARTQVDAARAAQGAERRRAMRQAAAILQSSTEVRVGGAVYTAAPHAAIVALVQRGDDASLALASGILDETLAAVRASSATGTLDPAQARERLEAVLRAPDFRRVPDWRDALADLIRELLGASFPELRAPRLTQGQLTAITGAVAIALLGVVAWSTMRGLRTRITREALLARAASPRGPRAAEHLRAAEEARRAGRLREALRELFLGALAALDERGLLRLDPTLTDRELLARVAHAAEARELEALVALYEPAWYGLREPSSEDVDRASDLARRVAA